MRKLLLAILALPLIASSDTSLTPRQRAMHALNRLSFGPRPGDVDRVLKTGVDAWVDQQLHPERIPDREVESRVQRLATMRMSNAEILQRYYAPVLKARKEAKASGDEDPKAMRRELMKDIPPDQRPQHVMEELMSQRILRAAESDRQLNEVMVDFWMNHFNVFAGKGIDRFLLTSYERDAIRPHIWGRFEDLLRATAKSPAMLFYLDNARSVAAPENRSQFAPRAFGRRARFPRPDMPKKPQGGLNENYAREIMELHTLGVDAGYTQKDVTELARVFTGWTMTGRRDGGGEGASFMFRPFLHDNAAKTVLGIHFRAGGGMEEGEQMIHVLAHHPATAHHIALELCRRLVADDPPAALVDRVAKRFRDTDGDLRETVRQVLISPEFWAAPAYRAKVKTPFEYVISSVRAIDAHIDDPLPIARSLQQIGEPLYGAQPPTGYSDKAEAWINTGALLNRLNFALALAANKVPGVRSDVTSLIPATDDTTRAVPALATALTGGDLTEATRATIAHSMDERKSEDPRGNTPLIAGLILGSPEFQRQ